MQTTRLWTLSQFGTTVSTVAVVAFDAAIPISEAAALASCRSRSRKAASTQALATANATSIPAAQPHRSGPVSVCTNGPHTHPRTHRMQASAAATPFIRVWVEIMGPGKYENVGKSQSVLMMINPIIFTRTRMHVCFAKAIQRGVSQRDHGVVRCLILGTRPHAAAAARVVTPGRPYVRRT
eukprot:COSAG01_NODE_227_length_21107_cov_85.615099_10_plen_181_part_00